MSPSHHLSASTCLVKRSQAFSGSFAGCSIFFVASAMALSASASEFVSRSSVVRAALICASMTPISRVIVAIESVVVFMAALFSARAFFVCSAASLADFASSSALARASAVAFFFFLSTALRAAFVLVTSAC